MKTVRDAVGVASPDTTYIFFKRVPIKILFFNFLGTTFLIINKMHFQYRKIKLPKSLNCSIKLQCALHWANLIESFRIKFVWVVLHMPQI